MARVRSAISQISGFMKVIPRKLLWLTKEFVRTVPNAVGHIPESWLACLPENWLSLFGKLWSNCEPRFWSECVSCCCFVPQPIPHLPSRWSLAGHIVVDTCIHYAKRRRIISWLLAFTILLLLHLICPLPGHSTLNPQFTKNMLKMGWNPKNVFHDLCSKLNLKVQFHI